MAKFRTALALIGSPGAGKTTFANYLHRQTVQHSSLLRCEIFDSSKFLENQLVLSGIQATREEKQILAERLFKGNPHAINEVLYKEMVECPRTLILPIIDSVRSEAQAERWKVLIPKVKFLYFDISEKNRFQRYNKREVQEGRKQLTLEEFNSIHNASVDHNLERLRRYAEPHSIIQNDGSILDLQDQAWQIMTNLIH